jgi:hypothetical protein
MAALSRKEWNALARNLITLHLQYTKFKKKITVEQEMNILPYRNMRTTVYDKIKVL